MVRALYMDGRFLRPAEELPGKLILEEEFPNSVTVYYIPPADKLKDLNLNPDNAEKYKKQILHISGQDNFLTIYPIITRPIWFIFLKPKYKKITSITLDGFDYQIPETIDDVLELLEELPSEFIKDYNYGLGLKKGYRFIINAAEEIDNINKLVISKKEETKISQDRGLLTLNFHHYDKARKQINNISNRAQKAAIFFKSIIAHNVLAFSLETPDIYPQKTYAVKNDSLDRLIASEYSTNDHLTKPEQDIVIKLVSKNMKTMAEEQPEKLIKLQNNLELVTLKELISKFDQMLSKKLPEKKWQNLFNDNPFILSQAFGYPFIKIQEEAHVGGRRISGDGGKITDFLAKHSISNNVALCEIKKPSTPLLNKTEYRRGVYSPSKELTGAINQILEQRHNFQKEIATFKDNSRNYNLESYSVHCILILGKTPEEPNQQKSFELFRGNLKDVIIITFDELLEKLKQLHNFLNNQ